MNSLFSYKGGRHERYAPGAPSFIYGAVFALTLLLFTGTSSAMEEHGMVSLEDYYSTGTGAVFDRHFLTTRIRLDVTKIDESGAVSFHFDGRERETLGKSDYNIAIRTWRMDTLNLQYSGARLYLAAGRLWPKDMPVERVDGVNAVYQRDAFGIGAFAGAKPNPYTEAFNADFKAAGAYVTYRKAELSGALSFVHNDYKGGTDRQYMYGSLTFMPLKEVFLYSTVTADVKQDTKKPGLTNASIELSWRPGFTKSFTVGYNRFHAIRYYRSMAFNIYDSRQEAYYIAANYRIAERYGVYGRLERQYRYTTPAVPAGYDASTIYRVGLTGDNIMDAGINMNISASVVDNYASRNDSYSIDVSKLYREVLQLVFTGSYNRNTYDITTSSDNVYTLGASGYWLINKSWNASLALDREQGETYSTNRLMTRVTFKF